MSRVKYGVEYWRGVPRKVCRMDNSEARAWINGARYMDGGYSREVVSRRTAERLAGRKAIDAARSGDAVTL